MSSTETLLFIISIMNSASILLTNRSIRNINKTIGIMLNRSNRKSSASNKPLHPDNPFA